MKPAAHDEASLAPHPLLARFRNDTVSPLRIDDVHVAQLVGAAQSMSVDELFGSFFTASPAWLTVLMRMRNAVVKRLGFEAGDGEPPKIPEHVEAGDTVGLFTVLERSDDEIVFGGDDRHMSLRISIARTHEIVSVATAAHERSAMGRAYLGLIGLFHGPIAAMVTRRCATAHSDWAHSDWAHSDWAHSD